MYLSLERWLSLFSCPHISYTQFVNKSLVKSNNGNTYPFKKLLKDGKIDIKTSQQYYKVLVTKKEKYLTNVYNNNFKIYDYVHKMPLCINNKKYPKYKNPIRNLYYKEILLETTTVQPNIRSYLDVIIDLYKHHVIDYKLVTPSIIQMIINNKLSSMLTGLYFKASVMNPTIPYGLSTHLINPESKVFTPTLGWSSYLTGFIHNENITEYVGIDVIKKVCKNTSIISKSNNMKCKIYCKPSEDVYKDKRFLKRYNNYFDYIFFSPPYYQLELYKGAQQSTNKYKTYAEWLDKYWDKTIKLCYHSLKTNRIMIYIISGYKLNKQLIDLDKDMNKITINNGFEFIKKINMGGTNVGFTKHKTYKETAYVFYKGNDPTLIKKRLVPIFKTIKQCKALSKRK